jgi:hypothetical protein
MDVMRHDKRYFKNGNKQLIKEAIAVVGLMLFLAAVGFCLAWYKGHLLI